MSLQSVGNLLSPQQILYLLPRQSLAGARPAAAASGGAPAPGKNCLRVQPRRKIRPVRFLGAQRLKCASALKIAAEE